MSSNFWYTNFMSELVLPNTKYIHSIKEAYREQYQHGETSKEALDVILSELKDPDSFVRIIRDKSKGIGLKPGQAPVTRYWLIDNDEYIGTLGLRKKITKKIKYHEGHMGFQIRPSKRKQGYGAEVLRLGLLKAKDAGLKSVYINCSEKNVASIKIIEKNGGVFMESEPDDISGTNSLHYKIKLT